MDTTPTEGFENLDAELDQLLADEAKPLSTPVRVTITIGDAEYGSTLELPPHYPLNYQNEHYGVAQDALGIANAIGGAFFSHFFPAGKGGDIIADADEAPEANGSEASE